jgi:hypothetical protein
VTSPIASKPTAHRQSNRDLGTTFVELLVAIVLVGIAVVGILTAVRVTVIGSATERDHAKAQQWLQSAVGVIEAQDFQSCDPSAINGATVEAAYQAAVDHPVSGAKKPYNFGAATLDVKTPQVWDGTTFVAFDSQSRCYDGIRLRQQRITVEVQHPNGVTESVEMIKVDR